jgi:glycosyltransferase involved in cell wall biosynthesis
MGARTCAQIARYLPLHGWTPIILTIDENSIENLYLQKPGQRDESDLEKSVTRIKPWHHPLDIYRFGKYLSQRLTFKKQVVDANSDHSLDPEEEIGKLHRYLRTALMFPDIYTGWIAPAVLAGLRAVNATKVEAIFSSAPCWSNHLTAYCLSRITRLPWLAHYRDPLAVGLTTEEGMSKFESRMRGILENTMLARASRVVCVTEEHSDLLRSTYKNYPAGRFLSIPNGFDCGDWEGIADQPATREDSTDKFRITYAGKLYIKRNPMPVFRALRKLIDSGEIPRDRVQFDLIGWCEVTEGRSVASIVEELGLQDVVRIRGILSHKQTLQELRQSDMLLLLAEELTMQIPGKTFEYLKAERPILALTPEGSVARLLRQTGGAWTVESHDSDGIIAALLECYKTWESGAPSRLPDQGIVATFDRRATTGRIAEQLTQIVQEKERSS